MNEEKIIEELGDISPEYVREAREAGPKRRPIIRAAAIAAAALIAVVGIGALIKTALPFGGTKGIGTDGEKSFYSGDGLIMAGKTVFLNSEKRWESAKTAESIEPFVSHINSELMKETDGNVVWSPASVYTALGMLAECADGDTLKEILSVLGADSVNDVRKNAAAIIKAETLDEEGSVVSIENSLWLNSKYGFDTNVLNTLSESFNASSYWADPKDERFSRALRSWLDSASAGFLNEEAQSYGLDPDMLFSIYSVCFYKSAWRGLYNEALTYEGAFRSPSGETPCSFMRKRDQNMFCAFREDFSAVYENTRTGGVLLMLPDEGVSVEEMLGRGGYDMIFDRSPDLSQYSVDLTVPKLDVFSNTDLIPVLRRAGVKTCFVPGAGDVSPLTGESLFVSEISHSARLATDEEGVAAAAFTAVTVPTTDEPSDDHAVFVFDRPFVMVILGRSGTPLFIAVINVPND